ncbi:MAG: glycoside hydrolase family 2 TIM barrel-domain containing protein [Candidatus Omnitrophota bacterium]
MNSFWITRVIFCVFMACTPLVTLAQEHAAAAGDIKKEGGLLPSSDEMVRLAWDALNKADHAEVQRLFDAGKAQYGEESATLGSFLKDFPPRDRVKDYQVMNDLGTVYFVLLESLRSQGKTEDAVALAKVAIEKFPFAQAWDASRGGYWSIAEKSRIVMDQLTGATERQEEALRVVPLTRPTLAFPGKDAVIDYRKYGKFSGVGTTNYKYEMFRPSILAAATGEGVYPNTSDVLKDPQYRKIFREGRLNGTHWDHVNTRDLEAAFYKWAVAGEDPGMKLFFTALIFEKAKMYPEAVKAYHALVVQFPRCSGFTYWHTPWYPAQAAIAKIRNIIRQHPEAGLCYTGGKIRVINGSDNDTTNDVFEVDPGIVSQCRGPAPVKKVALGKVKRTLGGKRTSFVQYANGHWRMLVNGKPYMIKGITYAPTKIGQSPDNGTLENWMYQKDDSMHWAWVDKNGNNAQDADEMPVGDFQLMKDMGVNAVRIYHNNNKINISLLREMYEKYGIMVVMGDFVGKYALGSGADWKSGTDYENTWHLASMMRSVEAMVRAYKDEPFILMWLLGNENNYGVASNADKKPEAYFKFLNAVARRIKEIDPSRPVAVCNGDTLFLDKMAEFAPQVDAYGANVYRGDYGFGSFWDEVRETVDRPAFITEYGAPGYSKISDPDEAEEQQAMYHQGSWMDIMANSAGFAEGEGNAVGGIAFEWLDEWWKNYEPRRHDTKADVIGPFAGGYYFEEWFGLVGQGNGGVSPLLRQPRKAFYKYREMWAGKK